MTDKAASGTILRAKNGDVIRYDETGLILRLSDRVIADIARRIGPQGPSAHAPMPVVPADPVVAMDAGLLGDIDAWGLRRSGDWDIFSANLPGAEGPRQYRRRVPQGDGGAGAIVADAPGALLAVLALGGPRAAHALVRPATFPYHVLTAADDIGAVGMAGVEAAPATDGVQALREVTRDALIAERLLDDRWTARRAMPVYLARVETDGSASIAALANGQAMANLMQAARNLRAAADTMAKPARIVAVRLDYSLEDVTSTTDDYRDGMLRLMAKITAELGSLGFHRPLFIATFDCGTRDVTDQPVLRAQWDLAWNSGEHELLFTSPGYMFAQDRNGRPTPGAMADMAAMDAAAITASYEDRPWFCPVFLLAEREGQTSIRVKARSMTPLVLDGTDPFGAGPAAGFRLTGATNNAKVLSVVLADDDPQDLIVTLSVAPQGPKVMLCYGFGAPARKARAGQAEAFPPACGSVRDDGEVAGPDGRILHRWALPCVLPVH
jgi:hypothetical protein